ncbi:hypothetical protein [Sphingopyxis sp.]|uniref:hypothetical protein n=1 Tax=Sphingopyxis sp. TaxID=1908224 RepID=UPI0035B046C6
MTNDDEPFYPDEEPDFDEPFADPAIRSGYQAALGRFIMAHNEVDFWMTGILTKAVKMLAPDGELDSFAVGDFSERLKNLRLLSILVPHIGFGGTDDDRLVYLNSTRNILAHGHFDQDPWEGTYEIVKQKRRSLVVDRLKNHNEQSIDANAAELEKIARHMSAVFDFIDSPVPKEYIEDPITLMSTGLWEAVAARRNNPPPAASESPAV